MPTYSGADFASMLRTAREIKALSQRELSKLAGVPQSHISKIESGAVDLRLSSLIELARVLDLELLLVPRSSVPAVQSVVRSTPRDERVRAEAGTSAAKEVARLNKQLVELTRSFPTNTELAQIGRLLRDLQNLPVPPDAFAQLRDAGKTLTEVSSTQNLALIGRTLADLQAIRSAAAQGPLRAPADRVRPAYSLDEDEHG
jgi:transcriptional regulator with XRE-family HTH domain